MQIVNGTESELGLAIEHRLRNKHNCNVISISKGRPQVQSEKSGSTTPEEDNNNIICDLTNSQECRKIIRELWGASGDNTGIDMVIICEVDNDESQNDDVGQRVETIGSNIQQMINVREMRQFLIQFNDGFNSFPFQLMINLVPKMMEQGNGKFVLVRNCRPPRHHQNGYAVASEYDNLLDQLLLSGPNTGDTPLRPNIDLVQVYCHGQPQTTTAEDMAGRVVNAIESGKSGIVDVSHSDFWTYFLR